MIYCFRLFREINTRHLDSKSRKWFCFCSLESDQDGKPDLTSPAENIAREETGLKGQEEDGEVAKTEEEEEEEKNVLAESRLQTGDDGEVQEVTGEEGRPAGSSVNGADGPFLPEEDGEDDPRSRFGKLFSVIRKSPGL